MLLVSTPWYNRLKERREELGLTVADLARMTRLSRQTIMAIEAGEVKYPRPDTVEALTAGLGMKANAVYENMAEYDADAEAHPYLAPTPQMEALRSVVAIVKPAEMDEFVEWARDWVRWPASFREVVKALSVTMLPRPRRPKVLGHSEKEE